MEVDTAPLSSMAAKEAHPRSKTETSCSARPSEEDQPGWSIPAGLAAAPSDSDVESVDVLRFDEPDGRASFLAGEPPPLIARNAAAVLAAFGATAVPAHATPGGMLPCTLLSS